MVRRPTSEEISAVIHTVSGRKEPISRRDFAVVAAWAYDAMPVEKRNEMALTLIYATGREVYADLWREVKARALAAGLEWPDGEPMLQVVVDNEKLT